MPLYYRKNDTTYTVYYYDTLAELNGPDVDTEHYIGVRVNGIIKYIGLTTNLSHTHVSDLRVRINDTTYGVMIRSKYATQSLSQLSNGTSSTLIIPNNASDIQTELSLKGACGGSQGGGGGGNSAIAVGYAAARDQVGTIVGSARVMTSGSGGSGGGPRCIGEIKNCTPTLVAGGQYRFNIGSGGNGSSGGGRGFAYCYCYVECRTYNCSDAYACADTRLIMTILGNGCKASSTTSGGSSYLQCYTGSSWANVLIANGGSGVNHTSYRNGPVGGYSSSSSRCGVNATGVAFSRGGNGGGGYQLGSLGNLACGFGWNCYYSGGSGGTSGANGGAGAPACVGPNYLTYYVTRGATGQSGSSGGNGCGCLTTCYWLNGN